MWMFMGAASGKARQRLRAARRASLILTITALALPAQALAVDSAPMPQQAEAVPGEFVVGFDDSTSVGRQRKTVDEAGGRIADNLDLIDSAVVVARRGHTTDEVARELGKSGKVEFGEPNYVVKA